MRGVNFYQFTKDFLEGKTAEIPAGKAGPDGRSRLMTTQCPCGHVLNGASVIHLIPHIAIANLSHKKPEMLLGYIIRA